MPDLSVATLDEIADELLSRSDFTGILLVTDVAADGSETRKPFHPPAEASDFIAAYRTAIPTRRAAVIAGAAFEILDRGG